MIFATPTHEACHLSADPFASHDAIHGAESIF